MRDFYMRLKNDVIFSKLKPTNVNDPLLVCDTNENVWRHIKILEGAMKCSDDVLNIYFRLTSFFLHFEVL